MGRKAFIPKATGTKYDLVYRTDQDPNKAPEREWVESDRHVGIGKPDAARLAREVHRDTLQEARYPAGHPLAWLNDEQPGPSLPEARRQEIIRLGFPDDGYDYLQHMRQGHGSENTDKHTEPVSDDQDAGAPDGGPSHFVPAPAFEAPPEDYKALDASRLTIHQAALDEDEAALMAGGATAFSKELQTLRGKNQREVEDLETFMRRFESSDYAEGDLLEDFVMSATKAAEGEQAGLTSMSKVQAEQMSDESKSGEGSDSSEEYDSDEAEGGEETPSEKKSFASTYWRPERHDRKGDLSVIDERFEQLALEYDSDEIGELDQEDGQPAGKGLASMDRYSKILDSFLAVHNTQDHAHDSGHAYNAASQTASTNGEQGQHLKGSGGRQLSSSTASEAEQALAAAALAKAKEHLRRLQEEDDSAARREQEDHAAEAAAEAAFGDRPRENWDCESILTSCSTAYNHPKRLDERPGRRAQGQNGEAAFRTRTATPGLPQGPDGSQEGLEESQSGQQRLVARPSTRRPDESKEEKKQRKEAVKEAKRQARVNKKELKTMFKEAAQRQQRQAAPPVSISSFA